MNGKVYADIKIDKEGFMEDMLAKFGRVLPFAVEIGYVCPETLDFILGKAGMEGNAIEELIKEETTQTDKPEESEAKEADATEGEKEEAVAEKEGDGDTQVEETAPAKEETNTEAKPEETAEAASE